MYLPVGRKWSRMIAISLMVVGFLLLSPPGTTPEFDNVSYRMEK